MKHHYVPEFYLKQWADPDGRVPHYRWLNGRAVFGRRGPEYMGFEPDLYAQEHVPPEDRHKIEIDFFSVLDSKAAVIHGRLMRQERFTFTTEERMDWAIYLAAANARTPDQIARIKDKTNSDLRAKLDENPEEVEQKLGYKPSFTLTEWVEKNAPDQLANFHLRMLIRYLTRQDLIQPFMDMDWTVHRVRSRHKELLTCDRPLWYLGGDPGHTKFTMMMTLSPQTVFIAANSTELSHKMAATPSMKLARLINESVFNRADERVYGRTTLEYAQRCFRLSRRNNARRDAMKD